MHRALASFDLAVESSSIEEAAHFLAKVDSCIVSVTEHPAKMSSLVAANKNYLDVFVEIPLMTVDKLIEFSPQLAQH